jgi:alpha-galactosidase
MKKLISSVIWAAIVLLSLDMSIPSASAATTSTWPPSRPVIGYNTWYQFRTNITENLILRQAQELVSSGLATAGYITVSLDDGWEAAKRTASGELTWNAAKFPHGIPWLVNQVHDLGLRFGIYTAIGTRTCQNLPGSWAHYKQDADAFAQWDADFVKVDECGGLPTWATVSTLTEDFRQFGSDLRTANPSVVYSDELPIYQIGKPGFLDTVRSSASFANMWRVDWDENYTQSASYTILHHLAADLHLHAFAGPGHWNDLDMILPGKQAAMPFDWTLQEQQSQLSVWAVEASPLLMSTDIAKLTLAELDSLKNPHMIAIDQSGAQAAKAVVSGYIEAVMKPDPEGGMAVLFANLGTGRGSGKFTLAQLGINSAKATGYDIWSGKTTSFSDVSVTLNTGQTSLLEINGQNSKF